MNLSCPDCRGEIPLEDVNVSTDVALCRRCSKNFSYAELNVAREAGDLDLTRPPKGAWFQRKAMGFVAGVSTRSWSALFLVPFLCVWGGTSMVAIYGSQISKGEFNLGDSLFGLPFLLGTIFLGLMAAMTTCGKVEVRVDGARGEVFCGVGGVGVRRRFAWSKEVVIRKEYAQTRRGGRPELELHDGNKRISLVGGVKRERLDFLMAALQQMKREYR